MCKVFFFKPFVYEIFVLGGMQGKMKTGSSIGSEEREYFFHLNKGDESSKK
jgi:hypothetical protein